MTPRDLSRICEPSGAETHNDMERSSAKRPVPPARERHLPAPGVRRIPFVALVFFYLVLLLDAGMLMLGAHENIPVDGLAGCLYWRLLPQATNVVFYVVVWTKDDGIDGLRTTVGVRTLGFVRARWYDPARGGKGAA